jgi:hypothetical protein
MVPLHAAFAGGDADGVRGFAAHARRFLEAGVPARVEPASELSWLQYLYLLSRFVALAEERGSAELVPSELPEKLREWVEAAWIRDTAWSYRGVFPGGIRERVRWKLDDDTDRPLRASYEDAILDSELFLFAMAADLRAARRWIDPGAAPDPLLEDIAQSARQVFRQRVVRTAEGGWLFQPGRWRDHPDFRFACRGEKQLQLSPCAPARVAEDVSHSHRMPLWLRSLAAGETAGSKDRGYYLRLLVGLESQFFRRVVVPPDSEFSGWRTRNFMDGSNGIYRWEYRSLGTGQGYGPYELSGTLVLGWWGFLPGERARSLFRDLAGLFPLDPAVLRLYAGPHRLELVSPDPRPPVWLSDGTAELLCRLAAELE